MTTTRDEPARNPVRRLLHVLLMALPIALITVGLVALPATATEDETTTAAEEPEGFGSGQWDGLIMGAVLGILVGVVVFADVRPGEFGGGEHH